MSIYREKDVQGRKVVEQYLSPYYTFTFTEDQYNTTDFTSTATTDSNRTYVGDIKAYLDINHPRYSTKFNNYQVDYEKLKEIKKKSLNTNSIPILIAIFTDKLIVWNLNTSEWEKTATWKLVNKDGCNYNKEKEWELQAYLDFKDSVFTKTLNNNDDEKDIK